MKAFITGVSGFVGQHLACHLINKGFQVWGTSRSGSPSFQLEGLNVIRMNFDCENHIINILNELKPDHIYHLAGQSSVKLSWDEKIKTFDGNLCATINLLEGIRKSYIKEKVKVLTVGSSEEYGLIPQEEMPITEAHKLNPLSPYGISKASVSMLAKQYYEAYGIKVLHVRPFNHIGPGQSLGFVTSDFAYKIAQIEAGHAEPLMGVGNLKSFRDFTDVRDICSAYLQLLIEAPVGESYNVCSGIPVSIEEILNKFISISGESIQVYIDPDKFRPIDVPIYVGSYRKISEATQWKRAIGLEQSLKDILEFFRAQIN